jgi:hypothetical protein
MTRLVHGESSRIEHAIVRELFNKAPPLGCRKEVTNMNDETPIVLATIRNLLAIGPITTKELITILSQQGLPTNDLGRKCRRAGGSNRKMKGQGQHSGWEWYSKSTSAPEVQGEQ